MLALKLIIPLSSKSLAMKSYKMHKTFGLAIFLIISAAICAAANSRDLKVGFYSQTCPSAEIIVMDSVAKAVARDPGKAAGLLRLHFHDCIVGGCDASILLDSAPGNSDDVERHSPGNPLLRGFEVIDDAKAKIEAECPATVSCADIMAFAARDSVVTTGAFTYDVPAGRRDGLITNGSAVFRDVPPITANVSLLKEHFEQRGLSLKDAVALSGAHSIGIAPCGAFADRLYFFNGTSGTDPSLDPKFAAFLKSKCPEDGLDKTADLDNVTPNRLDTQYYKNLKKKMGVLASDQTLVSDPLTAATVRNYMNNRLLWMTDFTDAMVAMGKMKVLTGAQGEIRRNCSAVN